MMKDIPTMVGIGLVQTKPFDPILTEPIALMEEATQAAFEDCSNSLIKDSIDVVYVLRGFWGYSCLLYTSPSPRDLSTSRMPSSA